MLNYVDQSEVWFEKMCNDQGWGGGGFHVAECDKQITSDKPKARTLIQLTPFVDELYWCTRRTQHGWKTKIKLWTPKERGFLRNKTIAKKAKTYDMRFNWLKCRQTQEQFDLIRMPGKVNKADYYSKVHPTKHYVSKRKDDVLVR